LALTFGQQASAGASRLLQVCRGPLLQKPYKQIMLRKHIHANIGACSRTDNRISAAGRVMERKPGTATFFFGACAGGFFGFFFIQ
jgi:hypothetical protein